MSPLGLARSISNNFGMTQTGPGNNMQDLSRLIQSIKPLPSSGTAERMARYQKYGLGVGGLGAAGSLPWILSNPDQAEDYAMQAGPYAGALLLGSRASRFGPGMGIVPKAVGEAVNPLLPRVAGPWYQQNQLQGQQ